MALRKIEIILPVDQENALNELIQDFSLDGILRMPIDGDKIAVSFVTDAEQSEPLIDTINNRFSSISGYHLLVYGIEVYLPRQTEIINEQQDQQDNAGKPELITTLRISREELYDDISDASRLSWIFYLMALISAIVAANGIIRNSPAIIIGAMVIAPLLGPNVALCLATTLADKSLARKGVKANMTGALVIFIPACLFGLYLTIDPHAPEIATRTHVGMADLLLALAAGVAGVLAFTSGISSTLIGVMVAVALVPPLVTCGLLTGAGYYIEARGAGLLYLANVIGLNLAGVLTFVFQGVRPANWWESRQAIISTRKMILLWVVLLLILVLLIYYSE